MKDAKHLLRLLLLLLLVGGIAGTAPAQGQQEVSGTVTDAETGETLPGASVVVPGTTTGTTTGNDGTYRLTVPSEADSLRFSFVGYEEQEVAIAGRSTINVALAPTATQLEDVVVIGYGTQQQRDVTGTVSQVSEEEFNNSAPVSPEQLISGKVAGVQVSSSSGAPGSASFIRIRGATSVNASSSPLLVVDGVPLSSDGNTAQRNPLNFLNPSDVASVTVLKDASATAIYGSRGANGVIIIETKEGTQGETRVSYTGQVSTFRVQDNIDVLGADQFRQTVNERAPSVADRLGIANTDWQSLIQRDDAFGQEHALSFSRGFESADVRASLGYLDRQGTLHASGTERVSLSLNYNQDLFNDQLNISTSLKGSQTQDQFEPGVLGAAASFDPTQPVRDVRSDFGGFTEWDAELATNNPVAEYVLSENVGETYQSIGNIEADYQLPLLKGLSLRGNLGYEVAVGEREFFAPTNLKSQAEAEFPGAVTRANFRQLSTLVDAYLDYDRAFDGIDSQVDATLGYSWQESNEEYPEYTSQGLSTNIYGANRNDVLRSDSLSEVSASLSEIPSRLISVFGRVNYTFMDRYLLTATVRRDGSSKFGPKNRWGTFPSAALAWRIHEEPFMEGVDPLSTLKLRLSAGITGNQSIGDFQYAPFYTTGGSQAQVQFGNRFIPTIRPRAADETLKWEETTSYNIGLDYGLLEDRVTGNLNFYRRDTNDLLFTVPAPGGANLSNRVLTNVGEMRNRGVEFSIEGTAVRSDDFTYDAQFNASYNENELLRRDRGGSGDDAGLLVGGISGGIGNTIQILREGESVNSFFTYDHKRGPDGEPLPDGMDHNGDGNVNDLDLYKDLNNDGEINTEDRYVSGSPQPDWTLGHTSRLNYRGLDFSFTLRAHLGQQVYNNVASNYGHYSRLSSNQVPTNIHDSALDYGFTNAQYFSDIYVEDASFLRVGNVTLGYSTDVVPSVDSARLFGRVSNAFLLTGYSGVDPEVYSAGLGIDNNVYPRSRTFTLGVDVQL